MATGPRFPDDHLPEEDDEDDLPPLQEVPEEDLNQEREGPAVEGDDV